MRLVDAHTHLQPSQFAAASELARQGLWQLVAATSPAELPPLLALAQASHRIIPTCGLHPWQASDWEKDKCSLTTCLQQVAIIGEIGLDTVWTTLPLNKQLAAFTYQLQLAAAWGKPVILHTKGAEAEVLQWLQRHTPPRIMVHWYAGDPAYLTGYIDLGCYFTLGPDIATNVAVQAVAEQVPLHRILTETDGTEAVAWARGKACAMQDVPQVLMQTLEIVAALKGLDIAEVQNEIYNNLMRFLAD
ncbi:MAG: TatD family hydrolase [Firmicutes bacterium]|nr:TatD family hydrolase [Bacillota bacterium]